MKGKFRSGVKVAKPDYTKLKREQGARKRRTPGSGPMLDPTTHDHQAVLPSLTTCLHLHRITRLKDLNMITTFLFLLEDQPGIHNTPFAEFSYHYCITNISVQFNR